MVIGFQDISLNINHPDFQNQMEVTKTKASSQGCDF